MAFDFIAKVVRDPFAGEIKSTVVFNRSTRLLVQHDGEGGVIFGARDTVCVNGSRSIDHAQFCGTRFETQFKILTRNT